MTCITKMYIHFILFCRFQDSDVIEKLSLLDLSLFDEIPSTYGLCDIQDIADHFLFDSDTLSFEWTSLMNFLADTSAEHRSIVNILSLLLNPKLGLSELYPNMIKLFSTAAVLPLSTAEVEHVFSQVKLIKNDHRNRLKQCTLENLLHVKIN